MRGPDSLELGAVGIIIAVAVSIAVWFGMQLGPMTQTLEAVSLAAGPKYNESIYRAVHGRWPSSGTANVIDGGGHGYYAKHLALDDGGVITAKMTLGLAPWIRTHTAASDKQAIHGSLSFRPELLGSTDAPTIAFLCGYAKPVAAPGRVSGINQTTLDKKYLPPFCR